jgi:RHS repeat-associated protein
VLALRYDANGNLCTKQPGAQSCPGTPGVDAYTFDAENRLKTRHDGTGAVTYAYDGNGTQVKRTNGDGSWTAYVGGVYEVTNTGAISKYYVAHGKTIAVRQVLGGTGAPIETNCTNGLDDDGDTVADDGCPNYVLADHLATTSRVLNAAGGLRSEQKYFPYGSVRTGNIPAADTDRQFTGQRREYNDSLGLYNYKARFYSTVLGRFLSADSIVPALGQRGQDRFAYAANNPLRYVDPTGHCFNGYQGFENLSCSDDDALAWWNCALACDNWIGDLARKGIGDFESGFWDNVASWRDTLAGEMVLALAEQALQNPSVLSRVPEQAWFAFTLRAGIPPNEKGVRYFKASFFSLLFVGHLGWIDDRSILGGGERWWGTYEPS